jgi:hypothetical protein
MLNAAYGVLTMIPVVTANRASPAGRELAPIISRLRARWTERRCENVEFRAWLEATREAAFE